MPKKSQLTKQVLDEEADSKVIGHIGVSEEEEETPVGENAGRRGKNHSRVGSLWCFSRSLKLSNGWRVHLAVLELRP